MIIKKGRISLEYLMTYGIAIAVIVIAVAALYTMDMFSPSSATVACTPCFANFTFNAYGGGTLELINGPRAITITSVTGGTHAGGAIAAGEQFTITAISTTGDVSLRIAYTDTLSGLANNDTATIHN